MIDESTPYYLVMSLVVHGQLQLTLRGDHDGMNWENLDAHKRHRMQRAFLQLSIWVQDDDIMQKEHPAHAILRGLLFLTPHFNDSNANSNYIDIQNRLLALTQYPSLSDNTRYLVHVLIEEHILHQGTPSRLTCSSNASEQEHVSHQVSAHTATLIQLLSDTNPAFRLLGAAYLLLNNHRTADLALELIIQQLQTYAGADERRHLCELPDLVEDFIDTYHTNIIWRAIVFSYKTNTNYRQQLSQHIQQYASPYLDELPYDLSKGSNEITTTSPPPTNDSA